MPQSRMNKQDAVEVPLTRGYSAVIDAEDLPVVSRHKWFVRTGASGSAYAVTYIDGHLTGMHTLLLPDVGQIDHKDGDGTNNRRANLRPVTHAENMLNRKMFSNNKSGFKGVYWHANTNRWVAEISAKGKRIRMPGHPSAEDAAHAYDEKARELHGEFACVNFPIGNERSARAAS